MTPQQHLERAEALLDGPEDPTAPGYDLTGLAMSVNALAHAVIALAIELGVPHTTITQQGETNEDRH